MLMWEPRWVVSKYCVCVQPEWIRRGLARPLQVIETRGNRLTFAGASALWEAFIGNPVPNGFFTAENAHLGVGSSRRATLQTMGGLIGAQQSIIGMDDGYPIHTDGIMRPNDEVQFRSTFGIGEAPWDWAEVGLFNASTGGVMLNRRPVSFGGKDAAAIWILDLYLRIYGNEGNAVEPPEGVPPVAPPTSGTCVCAPSTPGGSNPTISDLSQQLVMADNNGGSVLTTGVKNELIVRTPGTISAWDVMCQPSGTVEWTIKKGGATILTPTVAGDTLWGASGLTTEVNSGDVLEFSITSASGAHRSTVSLYIIERIDRVHQIYWADRSGTVLEPGVRGEHIARFNGRITGYDILLAPAGDITWQVSKNGSPIIAQQVAGSGQSSGQVNPQIPVSNGDVFEFEILGAPDLPPANVLRSTISLTVEP